METLSRFAENLIDCGSEPGAISRACIDVSPAFIPGVGAHLTNAWTVCDMSNIVKLAN